MPFSPKQKTQMFIRCARFCCLCRKQCRTNIEVAHIIDEAAGGSNDDDNGIPVCFDCHQAIGAYNNQHPIGNKFRPDELRSRRNKVYEMVASGQLYSSIESKIYLEGVNIHGGAGAGAQGGNARVKGSQGQGVTMIGGSIIGGKGGDGGGKGGDASLEGGDG